MSRKDYQIIAEALRSAKPDLAPNDDYREGYRVAWNVAVEAVAYELARDNPRFDPVKFRQACGYTSN